MSKILISWIALTNDFTNGKVNMSGPTMCFHRFHWNHDLHVLLANENDRELQHKLVKQIRKDFGHEVNEVTLKINNVLDINEIKGKVEKIMLQYREDVVDIFASPGTSAMQVAWYICHTTLAIKGRFLQTRAPKDTKTGKSELYALRFEKSEQPVSVMIFEEKVNEPTELKTPDSVYLTPALKEIWKKALPAASTGVPVLITGDTGTGKELLARYIHENSPRKNKEMVAFNCSIIGHELLESRLFGYKKGAFTGASKDTKGLFEEADGSSIFLDEIGDITPYIQKSLLRVIQEKEILAVGDLKPKKIDVRVIAATNKNLRKLCEEGKFRWDLYYRLSIVEVTIPSLSAQGRDAIEKMLEFFLKQQAKVFKKPVLRLQPDAREALLTYAWPGNIREMENLISRLYIYCSSHITLQDLPSYVHQSQFKTIQTWRDAEKLHIERILEQTGGSRKEAFQILKYGSYNTFLKKLREYNLT